MADLTPEIETQENRWMRAWVQRDARALKAVTASEFILLAGSKPPAILDHKSFVDAATTRWLCTSYRFGDIYVRRVGALALFASQLELKSTMDGEPFSGTFWVTDLWRKGRVRRGRLTLIRDLLDRLPDTRCKEEKLDWPPLKGAPEEERFGVLKPIRNYPLD